MVDLGQPRRASHREIRGSPSLRRDAERVQREVAVTMPPRKASREVGRARTKTDTGGQVENTKAIGRTLEKELGKVGRPLREKGRHGRVIVPRGLKPEG